MDIKTLDDTYVAHTYARLPVTFTEGRGSLLTDAEGRSYIDLGTGIGVNALGHADPAWQAAVTAQLASLSHASNLYYTAPQARLAEHLCIRTGMKRVFFANSGAEANECAIKVARLYGEASGRYTVVTLENSFHGRTITTLAATGQEVFHRHFGPFPDGFAYASATDADAAIALLKETNAAAVMLELVQGEGGVNPLAPDYIAAIADYCRATDTLFIVDEVQTGNGRTGTLYAYEQYGITPDIVTTAKGLGGGLPIGACMLGDKASELLTPSSHGSTYGGNPVACAGALAVLSRIDDALLEEVRGKSEYAFSALRACSGVRSVTGLGLMIGIETVRPARDILNECLAAGVVVLTAKDKIRLLPALNIPMDHWKRALAVLCEILAKSV